MSEVVGFFTDRDGKRKPITRRRSRRIITRQRGSLTEHGYSIHKSSRARHVALGKAMKRYAAATVWHMFHAQAQLREKAGVKGPEPRKGVEYAWRIFREDRDWVYEQMTDRERRQLASRGGEGKRGAHRGKVQGRPNYYVQRDAKGRFKDWTEIMPRGVMTDAAKKAKNRPKKTGKGHRGDYPKH